MKLFISQIRENAGFTQAEFSKLLGVSPKTMWNIEQDSTNLSNAITEKIILLCGVTYDQIFFGKKYEKIEQNKNLVLERFRKLKANKEVS